MNECGELCKAWIATIPAWGLIVGAAIGVAVAVLQLRREKRRKQAQDKGRKPKPE